MHVHGRRCSVLDLNRALYWYSIVAAAVLARVGDFVRSNGVGCYATRTYSQSRGAETTINPRITSIDADSAGRVAAVVALLYIHLLAVHIVADHRASDRRRGSIRPERICAVKLAFIGRCQIREGLARIHNTNNPLPDLTEALLTAFAERGNSFRGDRSESAEGARFGVKLRVARVAIKHRWRRVLDSDGGLMHSDVIHTVDTKHASLV
jgi:hypothetical protein